MSKSSLSASSVRHPPAPSSSVSSGPPSTPAACCARRRAPYPCILMHLHLSATATTASMARIFTINHERHLRLESQGLLWMVQLHRHGRCTSHRRASLADVAPTWLLFIRRLVPSRLPRLIIAAQRWSRILHPLTAGRRTGKPGGDGRVCGRKAALPFATTVGRYLFTGLRTSALPTMSSSPYLDDPLRCWSGAQLTNRDDNGIETQVRPRKHPSNTSTWPKQS